MFKDVVLEITNAKASSPPDAQPAFTTIPTPVPTVTPAKIVDKSIFCDCGTRGPIASNKSYNTEKVIEATIEYIRNFLPKNLYPTKSSKPSIIYKRIGFVYRTFQIFNYTKFLYFFQQFFYVFLCFFNTTPTL